MSWSTQTALKTALTGHKLCESQAHFMHPATLKDVMLNSLQRWSARLFYLIRSSRNWRNLSARLFRDDCTKRDDDYDLYDEYYDYDEYNDTNDDKDTPASCGDCVCSLSDAATGTWLERKKMKMMKNSMMAKLRRSRMDEVSVFPLNQLESALNQLESATPNCSLAVKPQSTTEQI